MPSRFNQDPIGALLVCVVAATVLLRPTVAAPTNSVHDTWWHNSCGHHGVHQPTRHRNHIDNCSQFGDYVPRTNKHHVRRQMKIFLGSFQKDFHNISGRYKELNSFNKPDLDWLPKYKKPKKSKVVLRKFHDDLQKYVVAVHYLSTLSVHTYANFNWTDRANLLMKISNQMKGLLCEIETAVNASCQTVPKRVPASFPLDHGLSKHLEDVTRLYVIDWSVLNRFNDFIHNWRNLTKYLPHNPLDSDQDHAVVVVTKSNNTNSTIAAAADEDDDGDDDDIEMDIETH